MKHASVKRTGFTLVELLVVIGILAMLMALLTPVIFRAMASSKNAAIKAEIDMLHMAIMNYKNEYGSFPPCSDSTGYSAIGPAAKHLARVFPRCAAPAAQFSGAAALTPATSLVAWLSGFKNDPTLPLTGVGDRKKLFDFDATRLDSSGLIYFPARKPESPYVYISKNEYGNSWPTTAVSYTVGSSTYTIPPNTYQAQTRPGTSEYFNPDTFQILCAGQDGVWNPTTDAGDDDLSNFWKGTRKEYLDSLQ